MNNQLVYLMDEICAGVEVYFTGRQGGQYLKAAYILCDDYTELTAKLFLLDDDPNWSDRVSGHFKSYRPVLGDVESVFSAKRPADLSRLQAIHTAMSNRRDRRNDFFHLTRLLDLSVSRRACVEGFCDLLDYGALLFPADWQATLTNAGDLETLAVLLQLDLKSFSVTSVSGEVDAILRTFPRNRKSVSTKGAHVAVHPEDLHLRLCVTYGGKALCHKLRVLL